MCLITHCVENAQKGPEKARKTGQKVENPRKCGKSTFWPEIRAVSMILGTSLAQKRRFSAKSAEKRRLNDQ